MISVTALEKSYGPAQALKGISFEVQKGEVLGFLGPNGAGKSTTMKILTGYLLPTGGRAAVAGLDVVGDSLAVRRRIGYLPETTPLYAEMRVDEYLRFAAEIRGVPGRRARVAVDRVVELCGLSRMVGKNIAELSKGYRQRTGLAQAMVHEPDVLILDEPTSGLDPNQIVEVRALIERLGQEHTVVLSTHYLQEVEKSADRVVIISQGRIVADDAVPTLVARLPRRGVRMRGLLGDGDREVVERALPGATIDEVDRQGAERLWSIQGGGDPSDAVGTLLELARERQWVLHEVAAQQGSLEDVFRSLTLADSKEAGDA